MTQTNWLVYMVENRLGALYTGICTDIERRFSEHVSGGILCAKALKGKGPLTLKLVATVDSHSTALKLEYWIKQQSRVTKLQLIAQAKCLPQAHRRHTESQLNQIQQHIAPTVQAKTNQ